MNLDMEKEKVFIDTEAEICTNRNLDSQKICTYLLKNSYKVVDKPQDADIIILITCASVNQTIEASLTKVKELQKYNAELIVVGCLPVIAEERLSEIFKGKTICTDNLNKIDCYFPRNSIKFNHLKDTNTLYQKKIKLFENDNVVVETRRLLKKAKIGRWIDRKTVQIRKNILKNLLGKHSVPYKVLTEKQYHIKIARGCRGNCSYCVIRNAIGPFKSKPLKQCIEEFERGLNDGYKHFVITADDVGPYGTDNGSSLPELLERITSIPGEYEITIESLNPFWIGKYYNALEEIFKRNKITAIYIPFQSGNKRILKLMNRYSDIEKIRTSFPYITLSADFIVGFPTEKEEEFQQTLSLIKDLNLNFGLAHRFSCHDDTEAKKIKPEIPQEAVERRMKYMKKYLRSSGYIVFYKTLLTSFKWSDCLGFVKKNKFDI